MFRKQDDTHTGTILAAIPTMNIVAVQSPFNSRGPYCLASGKATGGIYGVVTILPMPSGAKVVSYKLSIGSHYDIPIAIQAGYSLVYFKTQVTNLGMFQWSIPVNDTSWPNILVKNINKTGLRLPTQPYGMSQDLYQGDYLIKDKNGGGITIGRTMLKFKLGSGTYIELHGNNLKLVLGFTIRLQHGLTSYSIQTPNSIKTLTAFSIPLSLGIPEKFALFRYDLKFLELLSSYQKINKKLHPLLDDLNWYKLSITQLAEPLWRFQDICGLSGLGKYSTIWLPCVSESIKGSDQLLTKAYTQLSPIFPVAVDKRYYDGTAKIKSANTIQTVKTPIIHTLGVTKQLHVLQVLIPKVDLDSDDFPLVYNTILTDLDLDLSFLFPSLLQDAANKDSLYVNNKTVAQGFKQKPLKTSGLNYLLPPALSLTALDPITGLSIKIYNNTSFVTQSPDGSIYIKDGWGSLIRMHGGHITISPALDLIFRPGRAVVGLVPDTVDITANNKITMTGLTVQIGANKDAVLASGLSGLPAKTVVLNRTSIASDNTGVVIRSNGNASITATDDLYIGLNNKRTEYNPSGVSRSNGKVVLDCGQELLIRSDNNVRVVSSDVAVIGHNYIYSLTDTGTNIKTNSMHVDSDISITEVSAPDLNLFLNLWLCLPVGGNHMLKADNTVYADSLAVNGQLTCTGSCFGYSFNTLLTPQDNIPAIDQKSRSLLTRYVNLLIPDFGMFDVRTSDISDVYTDAYVCSSLFKFYCELYCKYPIQLPGMCWQVSVDQASNKTLLPITVTSTLTRLITASYPGKPGWLDGQALISVLVDNNVKKMPLKAGNYTTNTPK